MENGVSVKSNLSPASFSTSINRTNLQVSLIVKLLKESIDKQLPITRQAITDLYVEWKDKTGAAIYKEVYIGFTDPTRKYPYQTVEISIEQFAKEWNTPTKAKSWFKMNLGAAIIQGKILAIPVIDL